MYQTPQDPLKKAVMVLTSEYQGILEGSGGSRYVLRFVCRGPFWGSTKGVTVRVSLGFIESCTVSCGQCKISVAHLVWALAFREYLEDHWT